jgi:plastocyanin
MRASATIHRSLMGVGVVAAAAVLVGTLTPRAVASGGGGCGRPVTDSGGVTVSIRSFCFGPTVLRTDPGAVVTFRNSDRTPHTVLGANGAWGSYGTLRPGQEAAYRFVRSGVYPYVCTYHPGMVGVVVVGDARGPGAAGPATADGPVVQVSPGSDTLADLATATTTTSPTSVARGPLIAAAGFALVLMVLVCVAARGKRRRAV